MRPKNRLIHNIKPTKFGHTREEALRIPGRADGARCALRFWWWVPAPFDVLTRLAHERLQVARRENRQPFNRRSHRVSERTESHHLPQRRNTMKTSRSSHALLSQWNAASLWIAARGLNVFDNLTQVVGRVDAEHFSSAEDWNTQPGEPKHTFSRSKAVFLKTCRMCAESGCDSNKVRVEGATKLIGMCMQIFP
jgi:hypothetical protein